MSEQSPNTIEANPAEIKHELRQSLAIIGQETNYKDDISRNQHDNLLGDLISKYTHHSLEDPDADLDLKTSVYSYGLGSLTDINSSLGLGMNTFVKDQLDEEEVAKFEYIFNKLNDLKRYSFETPSFTEHHYSSALGEMAQYIAQNQQEVSPVLKKISRDIVVGAGRNQEDQAILLQTIPV